MNVGELLSLAGKVAVVSGGSGGIGRAVCALLRAAGATVWSVDRAGAQPVVGTTNLACDLADADSIEALRSQLPERVDIFVHCAGITRDSVLWKLGPERWSEVLRVNLDAAFHLLALLTPRLRERGGSVVLVASINGERGKFGQSNYAASKAGLIGFAKSAARELGSFGVRVNCVAPGWIETDMTRALPEEHRQRALAETALARLGQPEDVASAVLFLSSPLSAHVTGQVLRVDGGQLMA
ncbi:MAG: SDR family oxidoreductase [Planctomycetaceae bacterium]|nr:SDR family oxidoreductase [Planctomycetaceae bacterium]